MLGGDLSRARAPLTPAGPTQVGATPAGVETPRCAADPGCAADVAAQPAAHRATLPVGPDPKWRFFWRLGDRPPPGATAFPELNAPQVVPAAFAATWGATMTAWGDHMLAAVRTVAEMAAVGLELPRDALTSRMQRAPHLLAPTGADLGGGVEVGTVFAGYHCAPRVGGMRASVV